MLLDHLQLVLKQVGLTGVCEADGRSWHRWPSDEEEPFSGLGKEQKRKQRGGEWWARESTTLPALEKERGRQGSVVRGAGSSGTALQARGPL